MRTSSKMVKKKTLIFLQYTYSLISYYVVPRQQRHEIEFISVQMTRESVKQVLNNCNTLQKTMLHLFPLNNCSRGFLALETKQGDNVDNIGSFMIGPVL